MKKHLNVYFFITIKMRVIIQPDYETTCEWVACYIKQQILKKDGTFVLGLPTGSTPLGVYKRLIQYYNNGELSFENVITFNMDEYVGLAPNHDQSYSYFMFTNLFNHINIPHHNINLLDGQAVNLTKECNEYERKINDAGGIDLFLCGVGQDGHLAFNEPGSSLTSKTRIKTLCEDTISANSRFFDNIQDVPRQALTVGIQTVMNANEVIMMATGRSKAVALKQCIEGSISSSFTCTAIQNHEKAIVISDELATDELTVKTMKYYKTLQKSINMMGDPIVDHITKLITSQDKILVTSPHPDDDVIGMGGTMQLFPNKNKVSIAYMTNGDGGLPDINASSGTRIKEAISALTVFNMGKNNVIDVNMPFYTNKNRTVTDSDKDCFETLLERIKPNHLFVCADKDPNGTHRKCYNIINDCKKNNELKYIWLYTGAWGKVELLGLSEPFNDIYITDEMFKNKLLSIKMHISQNPPVFAGKDKRDFVQRAIDHSKLTNEPGRFIERFKIIDAKNRLPELTN